MHFYPAIATLLLASFIRPGALQSFDLSKVDDTTKGRWCNDQKSTCPLICLQLPGATGKPQQNTCDPSSLVFQCICSNGLQPNSSQYTLTVPFYECQETGNQCVSSCNGEPTCQDNCRTKNPCGAQDPKRVNVSTTTSTTVATSTKGSGTGTSTAEGTGVYTGFGGGSTAGADSGNSGNSGKSGSSDAPTIAVGLGRAYGLAFVLACVYGGFAFML